MGNNVRTQADGTWVDGYTPPPSDWEDLERKIHGSWNGDRGGAYVSIGAGNGYTFAGSGLQVTGPTRLTYGGQIVGGTGAFKIRDNTWPQLGSTHAGRTQKIVQPIHSIISSNKYLWSRNVPAGMHGVGSIALACRRTFGASVDVPDLYTPFRVVDGSTLASLRIYFRVAVKRQHAPIAMPKFRVMRIAKDGLTTKPVPLKLTSDGTGFASPALVTSPSAWYANGAAQFFDYVCDQNNVIDVANYSYLLHIVEEEGLTAPNDQFDGLRLIERKGDVIAITPNNLADTNYDGPVAWEGLNPGTGGYRSLIVDPEGAAETGFSARNGIWLTQTAAAWSRTSDLDNDQDWTPYFIVGVSGGRTNQESIWQCTYPFSGMTMNLSTTSLQYSDAAAGGDRFTKPKFQVAQPRGNIYHSVVPTFSVSDLRFQ